jgi:hypothetical protein
MGSMSTSTAKTVARAFTDWDISASMVGSTLKATDREDEAYGEHADIGQPGFALVDALAATKRRSGKHMVLFAIPEGKEHTMVPLSFKSVLSSNRFKWVPLLGNLPRRDIDDGPSNWSSPMVPETSWLLPQNSSRARRCSYLRTVDCDIRMAPGEGTCRDRAAQATFRFNHQPRGDSCPPRRTGWSRNTDEVPYLREEHRRENHEVRSRERS